MKNLSTNAATLLEVIKVHSIWDRDAIKFLFPEPKYIGTLDPHFDTETKIKAQKEYWQWDVNIYGNACSRPVNGSHVDFTMNVEKSFDAVTYEAVKELKEAGLIIAKNNGFNTYYYQYIGN